MMGYSHYFTRLQECPPIWWDAICEDFQKLRATAVLLGQPLPIQYERYDPKPPEVTSRRIRFNGIDEEGYETFWLDRLEMDGFNFCKTNQRGYDIAVTALLCLVAYHAPGVWLIESDGSVLDWTPGLTLARQVQPECSLPWAT